LSRDWSSDVCSSDLLELRPPRLELGGADDRGAACPSLVGAGELAGELAAPQIHLGADAPPPRLAGQRLHPLPSRGVEEGEEEVGGRKGVVSGEDGGR